MRKQIKIDGRVIEYNIKLNSRAKGLKLHVYTDGTVAVTKSRYISNRLVERMVRQNKAWIIDKIEALKGQDKFFFGDYKTDKEKARGLLESRLEYFSDLYNLKYQKLSIRNQRTRWGSCSRQGNLSFNYRLLHLPANLRDYIIVHELCHLVEFNHSKKFWKLVSKAIPDYMKIRRELRGMGM